MKEITLTQGYFALVSDEDYDRVSQFRWYVHKGNRKAQKIYAWTRLARGGKTTLLHRFVMAATENQQVDHKDRNGLNCTRDNLRFSSQSQNVANSGLRTTNHSGVKGVHFDKWTRSRKRWCAQIEVEGRNKFLGRFSTKEEAAKAYDNAANQFFNEFACTNSTLQLLPAQ